jgi:hypothetical protein
MTEQQQKLKDIVEKAISNFNMKEDYLISLGVSERCICSKFSMYLDKEIAQCPELFDYVVDVEFNRGSKGNEYNPKEIDGKYVVVDLIVHKRDKDDMYGFQNLICIEMKKSGDCRGRKGREEDKKRLRVMTDSYRGFCYKIGFMIIADKRTNKLKIDEEPFLCSYDYI